jgi:anti-sigma factor RsiW
MSDSTPNPHPDEITLDVFLDGELPGKEAQEIEAHLQGCQQCQDYIQERQVFFELITAEERVSLSNDMSLQVVEKLKGTRLRLLTGVLSLEAVLAAVLLVLFAPMLKNRFSAIVEQLTLNSFLLWLGERIVWLGAQLEAGIRAIGEAVELVPSSGFVLTPVIQFSGLDWAGILGGIIFLWLLVNRILIGGNGLRRSRVS